MFLPRVFGLTFLVLHFQSTTRPGEISEKRRSLEKSNRLDYQGDLQ